MISNTQKTWITEDELIVGKFSEVDARLVADGDDVLDTLKLCVEAMKTGMVDLNPHDEYVINRATKLIETHKGEQG